MTTTITKVLTTSEVAERFHELAQQEKWFEIQDEFFADDVKSIEPAHSSYMGYAEGKASVREKGQHFVSKIETLHGVSTTPPIVSGNHFAAGRIMDLTVTGFGRIKIDEIMMYEVKDGQIISEQFFY
ncbi:MAG TPA: nuclear transport factor 2 family protein [Chitinophaga sp.]|uniref:nuclear transport factor 2 family protein n=1 Tax=Chitinophaga sp. TaxID=1869181 RepID=UPI002CE071F8|nr:nuclear transport factor 2 family protein [Chitinophaga sp.]HVI45071.1 nuclear transport factor 2 family protein [Chitinophaga sp.]